MNLVEIQDKNQWNDLVAQSSHTDILQMWEWGETKKIEGWIPHRLAYSPEGRLSAAAQVLLKRAKIGPLSLGYLAYVPYGPFLLSDNWAEYSNFLTNLQIWATKNDVFCIEIEPKWDKIRLEEYLGALPSGWTITGRNRQPIYKLTLDLSMSEEEILANMKKSTRYNIKYAQKKGVEIKHYDIDQLGPEDTNKLIDRFYDLLVDMQKRAGGYPVRSKKYFAHFFQSFRGTGCIHVYEANFGDDTIVMNISEFTPRWASSFYAGSNRLHPTLKAPYLLRWRAIQDAKARGCEIYDFWGIVPDSSQHKGYSDHKLSFGGDRVDFVGIINYPVNRFKSNLWEIFLKLQLLLTKLRYS